MKKLQEYAARYGMGLAAVYGFFLIPSVEALFSAPFLIMLRQVLSIGFAVCLFLNPNALVELGEKFGPKLLTVLTTLFGKNTTKNNNDKTE